MRKPSIFAFGLTLTLALIGCTSLLGDFDVATGNGVTPPGGEGGMCTAMCNDKCVDTTTDPLNCGACSVVCPGGQTCQTSKCACPTGQSFCNGMCGTADRLHCGPTCTPCQSDEICGTACTTAPTPAFKTVVRDPSGWKDPTGAPFAIEVVPVAVPGVIYECRTGPDAAFTPTDPPFAACDGAKGTGTVHKPTPAATAPEGTYRTEYRYRSDTYRSATISVRYYIHHSLDKVATCPRPGKTTDGPHFTDDEYFAAAQAFSVANVGLNLFPLAGTFPATGSPPVRTDPIYLAAPFIKIPFTQINPSTGMKGDGGWPAAGADYVMNERSLRHKYVMNPTRTMILQRRQYISANTKLADCSQKFRIGTKYTQSEFGPTGAGRGAHNQECEALVVNSHGAGLCLGPDATGKKAAVLAVDHKPSLQGAFTGTATATGINVVTSNGVGAVGGLLVEIPLNGGYWYKVATVATPNFTLTEAYHGPPGAQQFRFASATLNDIDIIPSGFPKMHSIDGHFYASGAVQPATPSPKTKCETVGCNTGKPWLTYLPP